MAILAPGLDYTDKDFDALRERSFNLITSAFPDWTSRDVADFGNILVELQSWIGDVLTYYQDNQANESRIATAQLRRSMIGLVKLIGYKPIGAVAATTQLTLALAVPPVGSVTILPGDQFRTQKVTDPVVFQALTGAVIAAGANPPAVIFDVEHSENAQQVFQSSSLPNLEVILDEIPFLDGSLTLTADDGAYSIVDDFLESASTDRHATITVDANDRATIRFGNGLQGTIPQGAILCAYKIGGGVNGNVDPGTITKPERGYTDEFGNVVQVTVTNATQASGGDARQAVESIRSAGPRSLRALTRSVSREDFEIHVLKVPGIKRALFLTSDERAFIEENEGHLFLVPAGGGLASQTLKNLALAQVTTVYPRAPTFRVRIYDPTFRTIAVQAKIFPRYGAGTVAQNATLDAAVKAALASFFALDLADGTPNPTAQFGYYSDGLVAYSDIFNAVRDVPNVRRIGDNPPDLLINGDSRDIEIDPFEFPVLGTVTLINGFTGQPLAA